MIKLKPRFRFLIWRLLGSISFALFMTIYLLGPDHFNGYSIKVFITVSFLLALREWIVYGPNFFGRPIAQISADGIEFLTRKKSVLWSQVSKAVYYTDMSALIITAPFVLKKGSFRHVLREKFPNLINAETHYIVSKFSFHVDIEDVLRIVQRAIRIEKANFTPKEIKRIIKEPLDGF